LTVLRKIGGFLVAPFPAALFQSIVVALWPKPGRGVFEHPLSMFAVICLYFWLFSLLLGLPACAIVRKHRSLTFGTLVLTGLFVGLVPICVPLAVLVARSQVSAYLVAYNVLLFALGGMTAGALFWFIAISKSRLETLKITFS
jgi:hypothetical protein